MKILFFGFETASQYVSIAIMDGISTILEGKKNAAEAKSPVADLEAQARYVVQLMENETRESSEMFRVRWTTVQWQSSNHQYQVPRAVTELGPPNLDAALRLPSSPKRQKAAG